MSKYFTNKRFSDENGFSKQNNQTFEQEESRFNCPECPYKTDHGGTFNRHMHVHDRKSFACEKCPYNTTRWESYQFHKHIHEEPGSYCCPRCSFKSNFLSNLREHTCSQFACPKCSFKSTSQDILDKHLHDHHLSLKSHGSSKAIFTCSQCDFETRAKGSMMLHNLLHNPPVLVCSHCEFTTSFQTLLAMHEKIHLDAKKTVESYHTKNSSSSSSDSIPKKRLHPGPRAATLSHHGGSSKSVAHSNKVFSCPLCGFVSSFDSQFKEHLATHDKGPHKEAFKNLSSTEKYECTICPHVANSLGVWKRHFLTAHHNEKVTETEERKIMEHENNTKRKYMVWPTDDKKEIYWCHLYSRHEVFERVGMAERRRSIMIRRGILDAEKVKFSPDSRFQNIAANMKMGRTRVTHTELKKIEKSVENFIKKNGSDCRKVPSSVIN